MPLLVIRAATPAPPRSCLAPPPVKVNVAPAGIVMWNEAPWAIVPALIDRAPLSVNVPLCSPPRIVVFAAAIVPE